jgi:hypothetical protein
MPSATMARPLLRPCTDSLTRARAIFVPLAAGRAIGATEAPDAPTTPSPGLAAAPPGVGMVNAWRKGRIGIGNRSCDFAGAGRERKTCRDGLKPKG